MSLSTSLHWSLHVFSLSFSIRSLLPLQWYVTRVFKACCDGLMYDLHELIMTVRVHERIERNDLRACSYAFQCDITPSLFSI